MSTIRKRKAAKKVTIADVARKVGYSTTVVSHAINGYARSTAKRVSPFKAARRMGYRPDVFARGLVTQRSQLIGLVVPGIITSFYPETILPLKLRLEAADYGLLVMTSDDAAAGERRAIEFLRQRKIDGLIVGAGGRRSRDASRYDQIAGEGTPVVMLDRWLPSQQCHSVASDNQTGAEQGTQHLLELGHRRIGVVRLRSACSTTRERMAGYKKALAAAGVGYDAELIRAGLQHRPRLLHRRRRRAPLAARR